VRRGELRRLLPAALASWHLYFAYSLVGRTGAVALCFGVILGVPADQKRCTVFFRQSVAAGIEAFRLVGYGRTPIDRSDAGASARAYPRARATPR